MSHEGLTPLEKIASDTIKLVIEIPKRDYEEIKNVGIFTFPRVAKAIEEATTLDDVKAELQNLADDPWSVTFGSAKQGLESAIEILDNIGKGDKG